MDCFQIANTVTPALQSPTDGRIFWSFNRLPRSCGDATVVSIVCGELLLRRLGMPPDRTHTRDSLPYL